MILVWDAQPHVRNREYILKSDGDSFDESRDFDKCNQEFFGDSLSDNVEFQSNEEVNDENCSE